MKIKLTQGQYAIVDDDIYQTLSQYKWCVWYCPSTKGYYAERSKYIGNGKQKILYMHRVILNAQKGQMIDHINGDTLDNRKENLRFATYSQNLANSKIRKDNTSGYKGVRWHKRDKIWMAYIRYQNKHIHLGSYKDKKETALAYNEAAKKYFGEYAKLNNLK